MLSRKIFGMPESKIYKNIVVGACMLYLNNFFEGELEHLLLSVNGESVGEGSYGSRRGRTV